MQTFVPSPGVPFTTFGVPSTRVRVATAVDVVRSETVVILVVPCSRTNPDGAIETESTRVSGSAVAAEAEVAARLPVKTSAAVAATAVISVIFPMALTVRPVPPVLRQSSG